MGWELRCGRPYFYQTFREGGHVRKRYLGCGTQAVVCSMAEAARQGERAALLRQVAVLQSGLVTPRAWLNRLDAAAELLLKSVLLLHGFRRVDYKWCKPDGAAAGTGIAGSIIPEPWAVPSLAESEFLSTRQSGPDECSPGPLTPAILDWTPLRQLAVAAENGCPIRLQNLHRWLTDRPDIWPSVATLAESAVNEWLEVAAGRDLVQRESSRELLSRLQRALAGHRPDALAGILARRAGVAWIAVQHADWLAAVSLGEPVRLQTVIAEMHRWAQRRLIRAVKALALSGHVAAGPA